MKRRDFIRTAISVSMVPTLVAAQTASPVSPSTKVVAPGPLPWMLGLDHLDENLIPIASQDMLAHDEPHLFDHIQMATLVHLCACLVPPYGGHPGAVEALTPEFLDFFVARSDPDTQTLYRQGLDMLETKSRANFQQSFATLSSAQADTLIRALLVPWMKDHLPHPPDQHFMNRAHFEIRSATRNSSAWALASVAQGRSLPEGHLYWFPIEPDLDTRGTNYKMEATRPS